MTSAMTAAERWQLPGRGAESYQHFQVPSLFEPLADLFLPRVGIEVGASQKDFDFLHVIDWKKAEEVVAAGTTVERNGIDVITGTLPYKQKAAEAGDLKPYFDFATNLNLKAVDHIDGRPAIRQITSRRLADVTVHEAWRGPGTVELRPNAQLPVFRLPVVEPLEGFYWRGAFTLVAGEILHDYLEAGA